MFKFKKNEDKSEDLKFNSEELDLNVLEKEIVELVDIVEDSESALSVSGELQLTDEVTEVTDDRDAESPLDDVEFPTEVRQIAEEFEEEFTRNEDIDEPTSLNLDKELEKVTQKRPYGDKVIAETLGLGEDDSLVTALRSEKIMGPSASEKEDESTKDLESEPDVDDKTLLVNMPADIGDLKSDLDSQDEEGILTLTEELNDEKNTTVDTAALKNCPLIEDSTEVKFREESPAPGEDEVKEELFQETKVDLSISQILSTDSLETDLKEELKEDFMVDSSEIAYQETQVEMPAPDTFGLEEKMDEEIAEGQLEDESSPVVDEGMEGFSGVADDEVMSEVEEQEKADVAEQVASVPAIDQEQIVEKILETLRPEIVEIVTKSVKEELPNIIEKVITEEIAKIKKFLGSD
ncbi:MAG: hypothetical protein DRG59_06480 [Deltaproteobacteria bacterium]|nr:MAG: hypothetical protein DRG59_06480 [Deltaproteobacteria bacterium]